MVNKYAKNHSCEPCNYCLNIIYDIDMQNPSTYNLFYINCPKRKNEEPPKTEI